GIAFEERVEALTALSLAGFYDEGYAQDLLVGALNADLYSQGKILSLFLALGNRESKAVQRLRESLWKSTIFKLQNSREVFAGLEYRNRTWGGLILASEIKTLSSVSRALYRAEPGNPRVRLMIDDIVNRGGYDGWGSTNANAAALLTLGEVLEFPAETATEGHRVELRSGGQTRSLDTQGKAVTVYTTDSQSSGTLSWKGGNDKRLPYAWLSADYVPTALGDQSRQQNKGFVVERELMTIGTDGAVRERRKTEAGGRLSFDMDTVVEEHISVVNPEERNFVAVRVPFAAGFELLNPELATAPKEARPSGRLTRSPDYALFEDDQVTFYYDTLPEGSYDFYFRLRASFEGSYTQPPANAELMYDARTYGSSDGTRILIRGKAR
ncbi:MAG TPA: hypothetical protein VMX75_06765, partial [Spirochaetia bacterium]|nr:hypothetical protein [Spirochaetia bacterium]